MVYKLGTAESDCAAQASDKTSDGACILIFIKPAIKPAIAEKSLMWRAAARQSNSNRSIRMPCKQSRSNALCSAPVIMRQRQEGRSTAMVNRADGKCDYLGFKGSAGMCK